MYQTLSHETAELTANGKASVVVLLLPLALKNAFKIAHSVKKLSFIR